jgi:rhodanese-related sulfurtransferase
MQQEKVRSSSKKSMSTTRVGPWITLAAIAWLGNDLLAATTILPSAQVTQQSTYTASSELECSIHDDTSHDIDETTRQVIQDQIWRAQRFEIGHKKRFKQCQLTVNDLLTTRQALNPMLIDIRKPSEFKLRRIPGSVNLPGKKILNQRQWQSRELVLVDKGHSYQRLDQLCLDLTEAGFKRVFVLQGGIRSWQAQGHQLAGSEPYGQKLAAMSPQEFFSERGYAHWMLVMSDIGSPVSTDPHIIKIQPGDDNAVSLLKRKHNQYHDQIDNSPLILVIADDPGQQRYLQDVATEVSPSTFFLDGGVEAYHSHLAKQKIVWNHKPGIRRGTKCGR